MSVPKFHDLSNNGTRTVLASSTVLMPTHTLETRHPPTQWTRPMHDPQYGIEKYFILILGVSYFFHLVYMVRFLSQEFLLVLHYLFTWPIFLIYMWVLLPKQHYTISYTGLALGRQHIHIILETETEHLHMSRISVVRQQERPGLNTARHLHKRGRAWHANQVQCAHLPDTECRWHSHGEAWQWVQQENTHAHMSLQSLIPNSHSPYKHNLSNQQQPLLKPLLKLTHISIWHFWFS